MRAACIAANLCSPKRKIIDGVAKLLTKSDIQALTRSDNRLKVVAAEDMMAESWVTLHTAVSRGSCPPDQQDSIFGKLATRIVFFLTKKAKEGPEGKEYKTLKEIKDKFLQDIAANPAPSHDEETEDAASGQEAPQANLSEVSDPLWIAKQDGFLMGKYYSEKGKIWKLDSFTAKGAKFTEHSFDADKPPTKEVGFDNLKKTFALYNGKLQVKVKDFASNMAHTMPALESDRRKGMCYTALLKTAKEHAVQEAVVVAYLMNPSEIRCATPVKKGELKLIPFTDLNRIVLKSSTCKHIIKYDTVEFYIEPPAKARTHEQTEWKKDTIFCGFWWVKVTDDDNTEGINMKFSNMAVDGVTFPILENTRALKAREKLLAFEKAAPAKKART